jgi:hypothetical protein
LLLWTLPISSLSAADIVLDFQGNTLTDYRNLIGNPNAALRPPDGGGAVGLNQVVQINNGVFAVYNPSNGALLAPKTTDNQFWNSASWQTAKPADVPSGFISDPRVMFDPVSQRWFASEITASQSTDNLIMVARSNSSNPLGGWQAWAFGSTAGQFGDYDTLSYDGLGIHIGVNNFDSSSNFTGTSIYSIPKLDLLGGGVNALNNITRFDGLGFANGHTPQAVVDSTGTLGYSPVLTMSALNSNETIRTTISGSGGPGATLSGPISLATTDPGPVQPAPQPGTGTVVDALDDRLSANVIYYNEMLLSAHTTGVGGVDEIVVDLYSETTNALLSEYIISDPNYFYFQPAIAVNPFGTVVVSFNRSNTSAPDGYIGSFARLGQINGTNLSFGADWLLAPGTSSYTLGNDAQDPARRWGDYAAIVNDPNNPTRFWIFNEVANIDATTWSTQITEIDTVPEPSTVLLMGVALVSFAAWRRRERALRG